nr:MAG TPA: hypothetical protein [Caudoviricetes sp.]
MPRLLEFLPQCSCLDLPLDFNFHVSALFVHPVDTDDFKCVRLFALVQQIDFASGIDLRAVPHGNRRRLILFKPSPGKYFAASAPAMRPCPFYPAWLRENVQLFQCVESVFIDPGFYGYESRLCVQFSRRRPFGHTLPPPSELLQNRLCGLRDFYACDVAYLHALPVRVPVTDQQKHRLTSRVRQCICTGDEFHLYGVYGAQSRRRGGQVESPVLFVVLKVVQSDFFSVVANGGYPRDFRHRHSRQIFKPSRPLGIGNDCLRNERVSRKVLAVFPCGGNQRSQNCFVLAVVSRNRF